MARGRLSLSQVRALTRVATPETEAELLELAEGCTTAVLERVVRAWKQGSRREAAERERQIPDPVLFNALEAVLTAASERAPP